MLDSAYAPILSQAQLAHADGVMLWAGYLPGGRVYHAWSKSDFDTIRQAGIRPVFVHVGSDGNEAVRNAWACGAQTGDIVALDVEAGWDDTYSATWAATVKAAGFTTWLYGLDSEVNAHGAPFDGVWVARYVYPTVPTPTTRESIQYWNSHNAYMVGVDETVCDSHWANKETETLDLDTARCIVFVRLSGEGLLRGQDQVDNYASAMIQPGANPEDALTRLNNDIHNDPGSLTNRVAALETKVGGLGAPDASLATRVTTIETKLGEIKNAL